MTCERHYHVAQYEGLELLRECAVCGLDVTNPVHIRALRDPISRFYCEQCEKEVSDPNHMHASGYRPRPI